MKKKVLVWVIALALVVSGGTYVGSWAPSTVVKATNISGFDDSLSTAYEVGSETAIQYEMDAENEKYDINVLYRFTAAEDYRYHIHVGGITDDKDTYVNVNILDADLNEYASFSTCEWDFEKEIVFYNTAADFQTELLGGRTYYVMLTCISHEYKETYAGTYEFCMTEEEKMNVGIITEDDVSVQVSADRTIYKKVRVDKSGWYELGIRREEERETGKSDICMDLYDAEGNLVTINEGKCRLEKGVEYDVLFRMAEDSPGAAETIRVNIRDVKAAAISKETKCTWVNSASCEFTAEETEQIIVYSHSVLADPRITVLKDGEEIAGNEDYPWGGSENENDFGVVCSVEEGQTYTFLMDDNNKSGNEVNVYVETWKDVETTETPAPSPTVEPSPSESASPTDTPSATPNVTEKPAVTLKPEQKPDVTEKPTSTAEPTKKPDGTTKPDTTQDSSAPTPSVITQPEPQPTTPPPVAAAQNPTPTAQPVLKQLGLSSVKCAKNAKKITGKVSVSKASIKIKVGKKAYKKAVVKGKKFTLKLNYKLKKKTKIKINVKKKGYKSLVKSYTVK